MFEDETVAVACPKCGHKNPVLVREFEESGESHLVCAKCKVSIKVEANEFRQRLDQVRKELEDLEREVALESKKKPQKSRKGDFQI